MRQNTRPETSRTHEGHVAARITAEEQLERSVMSCLLFESEFYENGTSIAERIWEAAKNVSPDFLAGLAIRAREEMNLRHAPLMLLSALAKRGSGSSIVSSTIELVIKRADEPGELLAIHARMNGVDTDNLKRVISAQMKKGVAAALRKFDAYQLAKYNRDVAVKLRDVFFLTHPKPIDDEQEKVWSKLINGTLEAPDTWEVALSTGQDKKVSFERLIKDRNLGYLALLRNLRNMSEAGVSDELIRDAILARRGADRVLPFRFVAAARACPRFEPDLDRALLAGLADVEPLDGKTVVLVDVSASMDTPLSGRSQLTRMDAAATLASIVPGDVRVFTFSNHVVEVPARKGMSGVDAIKSSQYWSGTQLSHALTQVNQIPHDRLIVITDEQISNTFGRMPVPNAPKAYLINVGSYANGVGYRNGWTHIDGFSESVLRYIRYLELGGLSRVSG